MIYGTVTGLLFMIAAAAHMRELWGSRAALIPSDPTPRGVVIGCVAVEIALAAWGFSQ